MAPNYTPLPDQNAESGSDIFSRNGRLDTSLLKQALKVSWHDLSVWVRIKKDAGGLLSFAKYEKKRILNNVSGVAKQGTLTAIMGSSGAGKTTMLAAVSRRMRGDMSGQVLLNGHPVDGRFMAQVSGFLPQHDLAVDCLTVREHMEMMARLKLDKRIRTTQRDQRLNALLADLGLAHCANTRLRALSGGERRRVSLAVELVTDPPVLFCDEPTTGLDSYSAGVVVDLLRRYASRGKVVVCTIHQPASGIFDMFHRVILLANGRLAFHGDVADATRHFDSIGLECPSSYNQAEFLVTQLAIVPGQELQSKKKVEALCDKFDESRYGMELLKELHGITRPRRQRCCSVVHLECDLTASIKSGCSCTYDGKENMPFEKYLTIQKVSRFTQFYWLLWRSSIESRRNPGEWLIGFSLFMFTAVLISVPYTDIQLNQKGIQNMQGFLYLIVTEVIFTFAYNVFHTFPREMPIMLREIGGGLYQPAPYYISKMIGLIPRAIVEPFIYLIFIFLVSDLRGGAHEFFLLCLPIWACSITATAYGCVMSAVFESMETAVLVSVPYEFVSVTFCGLYLKLRNLPAHLSWIQYISQFYYGDEAVSILQWSQIPHIDCEPNIPCVSTGDGALAKYGYDKDNLGLDFIGFGCIYLFCHIVGFLAVLRRSKRQAVY